MGRSCWTQIQLRGLPFFCTARVLEELQNWTLRASQFLHSTDIATTPPRRIAWGPFPMEVTSLGLGKMKWWTVEAGMKSQTLPFRTKWTVQMLFVLFILSLAVGLSANLTVCNRGAIRGTDKGCKQKHHPYDPRGGRGSYSRDSLWNPERSLVADGILQVVIAVPHGVLVALGTRQLLEASTNPRGAWWFWKASVGLSNLFDG